MRTFRWLGVAVLLGGALAITHPASSQAPTVSALKGVQDRYASIHSVFMRATGRVLVTFQEPGSPALATFSISYWAEGPKFRVNYRSNAVQGLPGNRQVAWDGESWQRFDEASSILAFTTRELRQSVVAGPNPFFLPLLFLTPDSDQCPLCDVRLPDLLESSQWGAARLSDAGTRQVSVGPRSSRDPWAYEVQLGRIGNSVVPLVVQRKDRNGQVLVEVTSKDFRNFGNPVGMIPMTVETRSVAEDGRVDSQGSWMITELQINGAIDPSLFRLRSDDAEIVIDDDTGVFMKHPLSRMVGHSMKDLVDMPAEP